MSVFHPTETEHRAEGTNQFKTEILYFELFSFKGRIMARKCLIWGGGGGGVGLLGTSHNLRWRGGVGGEIGGPSIFFWMEYGGP